MNNYKCYCTVCNRGHVYAMTPEEFKSLITCCKHPLDGMGRLILACDECSPLKYSVKQ